MSRWLSLTLQIRIKIEEKHLKAHGESTIKDEKEECSWFVLIMYSWWPSHIHVMSIYFQRFFSELLIKKWVELYTPTRNLFSFWKGHKNWSSLFRHYSSGYINYVSYEKYTDTDDLSGQEHGWMKKRKNKKVIKINVIENFLSLCFFAFLIFLLLRLGCSRSHLYCCSGVIVLNDGILHFPPSH